jgi:tRNA nucleotidyltransferase/poly(A) polymerase
VGGAVRDGLLGRRAPDVDVAVDADPERLARALEAAGVGRAVPISEAEPRVFRVAARMPLDLAGLEGATIEEDLARRDFTANAIAIDLRSGSWIDPFGGAKDLAGRRLRLVRPANVEEDPLRAFRAARFLATHRLRPDRWTRHACVAAAPRLSEVAAERVRAELCRMLEAPRVAPAFGWARRAGLLSPSLFIAARPAGWRAAERILARLDPASGRLDESGRRRLRLAAIARALDLSRRGACGWLGSLRFGRRESGEVATLVDLARRAAAVQTASEAWDWIYDAGDLGPQALALLTAAEPRRAPLARRLGRLRARCRKGPVVRGSDVAVWLAMPPGPELGAALRRVRIEILRGRVLSRAQARRFLREQEAAPNDPPGPGGPAPNNLRKSAGRA